MRAKLLNFVTALSLLLTLSTAGMWARSRVVTEGWDFKLVPRGIIYSGEGWHEGRTLESGGGRIVFARYRTFVRATDPPQVVGYQRFAGPVTRVRHNRRIANYPYPTDGIPPATFHLRIPGVAEWCSMPGYFFVPPGEIIAVSWLGLAVIGTVLPGVRIGWRLWPRRSRPAFPLIMRPSSRTAP